MHAYTNATAGRQDWQPVPPNGIRSRGIRSAWAALGVMVLLSLTACNTMRGMGQDIQQLGAALENAAEEMAD